ncbi:gluconokinase [Sphingomonas lenta]|uniref:Gluconokinase n=2 Tax=Sphingomonas lenta TaxID=1141887 RepID=A0A2A2SDU2_9SPHN|nr:gluconokinase [Sphingomonas lenta]
MGVSGAGKTAVGRALADALGCLFLEGDDFHPPANVEKMRAGEPLTDADRAPWLDSLADALAAHEAKGERSVLACSALRRRYRDRLAAAAPCRFVLLDVPTHELARRLERRADHFMPAALLESQLATLEPLEPDENGCTLAPRASVGETVSAISSAL